MTETTDLVERLTAEVAKWEETARYSEKRVAYWQRKFEASERGRDDAIYALNRFNKVRANAPDWEKLWEEQTEALESAEAKVLALTEAMAWMSNADPELVAAAEEKFLLDLEQAKP